MASECLLISLGSTDEYGHKMEGLSGLSQATRDLLRERTKPDFRKQSTTEGEGPTTQEAQGCDSWRF